MNPDELRQQVELKVVELLKVRLADGSLTEERAQAISQKVLELLTPGMTWEELYRAIPKLDDAFPELAPVVLPIVREYEERIIKQAEVGVRQLIRQGQYNAASRLAQKAIKQDVNLVWQGSGKVTPTNPKP